MEPLPSSLPSLLSTPLSQQENPQTPLPTSPGSRFRTLHSKFIAPELRHTRSGQEVRDMLPLSSLSPVQQMEYERSLQDENVTHFERFRERFVQEISTAGVGLENKKIAVVVTGSDGRGEKTGNLSPFELIVIPSRLHSSSQSPSSTSPLPHQSPAPTSPTPSSEVSTTTSTTNSAESPLPGHHFASGSTTSPLPLPESCQFFAQTCSTVAHPVAGSPLQQFKTLEKVKEVVSTAFSTAVDQDIELKPLTGELGPVNIYSPTPAESRVFPTRPLDAILLAGSPETFEAYKRSFIDELQAGAIPLVEFRKKAVKDSRRILKKQLQNKLEAGVCLEKGEFVYATNPLVKGSRHKGPKYGPIRFLQYSVALRIIQHVQKISKEEAHEFMSNLPHSIVERVRYLAVNQIIELEPQQIETFRSVYDDLIYWYGVLQDRATRSTGPQVIAKINPLLLKDRLEKALELGEKISGITGAEV